MAAALGITHKELRNFLQRSDLSGVGSGRQGVRQRFSVGSIRVIRLAWELYELGLSARLSATIAGRMVQSDSGSAELSGLVGVRADLGHLNRLVDERLAEASQTVVVRRRGRPPSRDEGRALA